MNSSEFMQSRESQWRELSRLLGAAEDGIDRLAPEHIRRLGQLYRAVTSDLAYAQREFPSQRVTLYLNQLVGRAHAVVYRSEPLALGRLIDYVARGFPRSYREMFPYTGTATLLFLLPALLAGIAVWINTDLAVQLVPGGAEMIPIVERQIKWWEEITAEVSPAASSGIMTNNIQVAFMAFGGGLLAGLLTVWVLISNGLSFGGIMALTWTYGIGFDLTTFVIGHGVIELSVIFMAGGAGLRLGWAILRPGYLSRRAALAEAGRQSARLLIGCVPLLVIAGTIEGFISPNSSLPWQFKWWVGIGTGVLLYLYVLLAGRGDDDEEAAYEA
jgi:uncharacterized membrane protein SpoIIM required for sporulation